MDKDRIEYLHMIQEPICRMSTISAVLKGFAATIVAGIALVSYSSINWIVLTLSFLPVLSFALLDIYYLGLERRFRYLFNQVRTGEHPVDFSMEITKDPEEVKAAKAQKPQCLLSPSIYLFYAPMLIILGVVVKMKFNGVL